MVVVAVPLVAHSALLYASTVWAGRIQTAATSWVSSVAGASVTGVDFVSTTAEVHVDAKGDLPPTDELLAALQGQVPDGITVVVKTTVGQTIDAGTVGG
jgi:hypothetical protein